MRGAKGTPVNRGNGVLLARMWAMTGTADDVCMPGASLYGACEQPIGTLGRRAVTAQRTNGSLHPLPDHR